MHQLTTLSVWHWLIVFGVVAVILLGGRRPPGGRMGQLVHRLRAIPIRVRRHDDSLPDR